MARKGILLNNPDVDRMSRSQWMFEYHALRKKELSMIETFADITKSILISTLGLNSMRPRDEQGRRKLWADMSDSEKESFIPLIAWCGHPEMVEKAFEGVDDEIAASNAFGDARYEELVKSIDDADGDMEPILGQDWPEEDPTAEADALGIPDISKMKIDVEGDV